jgi:hypothetical protein
MLSHCKYTSGKRAVSFPERFAPATGPPDKPASRTFYAPMSFEGANRRKEKWVVVFYGKTLAFGTLDARRVPK